MAGNTVDILANIKIASIDASAIGKALSTEVAKAGETAKGGGGLGGIKDTIVAALKGSGSEAIKAGGKAMGLSGDIIGVIQAIFGESVQDLVNVIQGIVKTFAVLFAPLGALLILLKIIGDVVSAMSSSFNSVMKIWGMIMEMVSKMVQPFINLLIPLLIPFLYLASTLARMLNMLVMPLFSAMMKAFSGAAKGALPEAMKAIMGGDLMGGIDIILKAVGATFLSMKDQIVGTLMPIFSMLANWVKGFLNLDIGAVHETINNLLGKELGNAVNGFIDILYAGVSALAGFIAQFVGKETINKLMGEGTFEKTKETNVSFGGGADFAKAIQDAIGGITTLITDVTSQPIGILLANLGTMLRQLTALGLQLAVDFMTNEPLVVKALTKLLAIWNQFSGAIKQALTDAFGEDGNGGLWKTLKASISAVSAALDTWAKDMSSVSPSALLKSAIDAIAESMAEEGPAAAGEGLGIGMGGPAGLITSIASGLGRHGDFVMRPGQAPVEFSPNDTIMGAAGGMGGGGGGTTINQYFYGNGDRYLAEVAKRAVEETMAKTSRGGYFQKGY